MAGITINDVASEKDWEGFLAKHPEANFLQSWYWGEFHQGLGDKIQRTGFYDGRQLLGIMLSVVENAKRGRYLTVPGGPIIDWQSKDHIKTFVEEIKKIAKLNGCVFVRVRPQLESSEFSQNLFSKSGFTPAPMHLHAELTSQLDITKTEEELLAKMRKTTRYEIRKAISQGVTVAATDNPDAIKEFYDLQVLTAQRQNFIPFSYQFLNEQFKVFSRVKKALLYRAQFENKLLAQAFIIFYGEEAVYHYGASTDEGRKYPGAYLIQWEAIKEAKTKGMKRYNFWGVSPQNDEHHRFAGLSLFKRGFGGVDVQYLPAHDLPCSWKYSLTSAFELARKKTRGL